MVVFHKLCRTTRSSRVHRTESVSVMDHARLAAVSSQGQTRYSEISLSMSRRSEAWYCQIVTSCGVYTRRLVSSAFSNDHDAWSTSPRHHADNSIPVITRGATNPGEKLLFLQHSLKH